MTTTVFNINPTNHLYAKMFFDEGGSLGTARYDVVKYPEIEFLTEKQIGFFWQPGEVDIGKDRGDFANLTPWEQHIFTANLKRQIVLDSVQGRSPTSILGPVTTLPEMEVFEQAWGFFETIHSRSYTHVIQNVFPEPSKVFDEMMDIPEIIACAEDISKYYDDFGRYSTLYLLLGYGEHTINGETIKITEYELKKKLWLTLASINILEGIRFYVSFACSWAFAENKKMEGNAKIIRLICRDENLHLALTQKLMTNILPADDPMFAAIKRDTRQEVIEMFKSAMNQEKEWAQYLFKDGSIIGLNADLLSSYVDWLGAHRMRAVGYVPDFEYPSSNPLPWVDGWISSKNLQVAPQETEQTMYVSGGIDNKVDTSKLGTFNL